MEATIDRLSPDGLHRNPAYSQVVSVAGPIKTVYVGGQNAVDADGRVVGKGDLKVQSRQALRNVQVAVEAAGGELEHVIKWSVFLVEGQPVQEGFEAFVEIWPRDAQPPLVTAAFVTGLAHPDYLVEIEAVAAIPMP
jgi:enamine deaminase RidA (YjgF/YER057c/UK114 family)